MLSEQFSEQIYSKHVHACPPKPTITHSVSCGCATTMLSWSHLTRGGQLSKCPKMWLFWCKSCLHDKTRWLMKFKAKMTTPLVWTEIQFKFWHWVSTLQAHYRPPRLNQGLFSSQNKTGGLPLWYQTILSFEKYIWWGLISHLFWHPFFWFSLREMGQNGASGQVLLRFAPFLLQWYSLMKCRRFI